MAQSIDRLWNVLLTTIVVTALTIVFGILHDLLSVSFCVEYLRDHHPNLGISSPIGLALAWGVLATWWIGLPAGLLFGKLDNVCRKEPRGPRWFARVCSVLLGGQLLLTVPAFGIAVAAVEPASTRWQEAMLVHRWNYFFGFLVILAITIMTVCPEPKRRRSHPLA